MHVIAAVYHRQEADVMMRVMSVDKVVWNLVCELRDHTGLCLNSFQHTPGVACRRWAGSKVVCELKPAGDFYVGEEYHQQCE